MSDTDLKAFIQQFEDAYNRKDLEAVAALYAENAYRQIPDGTNHSREQIKESFAQNFQNWPDLHITFDPVFPQGDVVTVRLHAKGTHSQSIAGEPPTGKTIEFTGISIFRVENGQSVESWSEWDRMPIMQQIGLIKT